MSLSILDKYIWDFWLIRHNDAYHIFYLQAPRTTHNDNLRHYLASVGHARSADLKNWEILPDALHASQLGAWDDRAIWTGCVVERDRLFYMFYTSSSRVEDGKDQRIGVALSEDLMNWERYSGNPVLEADSRWYEKRGDPNVSEETWRDPHITFGQDSGNFYTFICSRVNYGPFDGRGSIGLACSGDLLNWEVMPPAFANGEFAYMEVPQSFSHKGLHYILFSVGAEWHSAARRARVRDEAAFLCGTYALVSESVTCGYTLTNERGLVADEVGTYYAGKFVLDPNDNPIFLATCQYAGDGVYLGILSDPMPVSFDSDGSLRVQWGE